MLGTPHAHEPHRRRIARTDGRGALTALTALLLAAVIFGGMGFAVWLLFFVLL